MNDSKSPDRWTGDFEFNIESTFDLSNCISSNTCKDQLLYETIDHVADLKAHFDEKLEKQSCKILTAYTHHEHS